MMEESAICAVLETSSQEELLSLVKDKLSVLKENLLDPPKDDTALLYACAAKSIHVFRDPKVHDLLLSLLQTSQFVSVFKNRKTYFPDERKTHQSHSSPVVAAKILWALHQNDLCWNLTLLEAYLDDALECRVWVECKDKEVEMFCRNILAWMYSNDIRGITDDKCRMQEFSEEEEEESETVLLEESETTKIPPSSVTDRYIQSGEHPRALEFIISAVKTKQSAKNSGGGLVPLVKALQDFCIIPDVRLIAARNLSTWLGSPALIEHLGRLLPAVSENVQRDPLLPSDVEVITLLCRLRSSLKQSLTEIHRGALVGLMLRQSPRDGFSSTTGVQRLLVRTHLEESFRNRSSGSNHGAPDAIKILSSLLLALDTPTQPSETVFVECGCEGVARGKFDVNQNIKFTGHTTYSFPKRHRCNASQVLGDTLSAILFPTLALDETGAVRDGESLPNIVNKPQLSILLDDVLKVIKSFSLPSFCPDLFWYSLLWCSSRSVKALSKEGFNTPSENVLYFVSELAASVQLLYANDVIECRKYRDKRMALLTPSASGSGAPTNTSGLVKPGRGLSLSGGRGGRGTAGLSLSSKTKGKVPGRGVGLSSARMKDGKSGNISVKKNFSGDGNPANFDSSSMKDGLKSPTSRSGVNHTAPTSRSSDDTVDPQKLCQQQTDLFLFRASLVQNALMHWFATYVSFQLMQCLENPQEGGPISWRCTSVESKISSQTFPIGSAPTMRNRSGSNISVEEFVNEEDMHQQYGMTSSASHIKFLQRVLLIRPASSIRLSNVVDKMAVLFCNDNCILKSSTLGFIVKAISAIVDLEQYRFWYRNAKLRDNSSFNICPPILLCNAVKCELSFINTLSNKNEQMQDADYRTSKGFVRAYNCSHFVSSGLDLVELVIRRALDTNCCYNEKQMELSGLLIEEVEFIPQLLSLCKLPVYKFDISESINGNFRSINKDIQWSQCLAERIKENSSECSPIIESVRNGDKLNETRSLDLKSSVAYQPLYWQVCFLCYVLACASPRHVGSYIWENVATSQTLMLMSITERFHYPPAFPVEESVAAYAKLRHEEEQRRAKKIPSSKHGRSRKPRMSAENLVLKSNNQDECVNLTSIDVGKTSSPSYANDSKELSPSMEVDVSPVMLEGDLSWLLNKGKTVQQILKRKQSRSDMQTAMGTLKLSQMVRKEDGRLWNILFTRQSSLNEIFAIQQRKLNVCKEASTKKINDVESVDVIDQNADAGNDRFTVNKDSTKAFEEKTPSLPSVPDLENITEKASADVPAATLMPRRSSRQRVSRFNVVDLMRNEISSSDCSSNDSSDDDMSRPKRNFHGRRKSHSASRKVLKSGKDFSQTTSRFSQHSTLWGLPQESDVVLLPLQSISREPSSEALPSLFPATSPIKSSVACASDTSILHKVQQWHEKYMFGISLRNSTSPDFIAAVVMDHGTEVEESRDGNRVHDNRSTAHSRQHIMESIGWLVPAISAASQSDQNHAVSDNAVSGVLRRIPPLALVHLLLVISLKILQVAEGPKVRLRQLIYSADSSKIVSPKFRVQWSQDREKEIVSLLLTCWKGRSNMTTLEEEEEIVIAVRGVLGSEKNDDLWNQEQIITGFVKSKPFVEDSALFCELVESIRKIVWNRSLSQQKYEKCLNSTFSSILEFEEVFHISLLFELVAEGGRNNDQILTNNLQHSIVKAGDDQVANMLGSILIELWHHDRDRRAAARIVLISIVGAVKGSSTNFSSAFDCITDLIGLDRCGAKSFSYAEDIISFVATNVVRIETEAVVLCQALRVARRLGNRVCSSVYSVMIESVLHCPLRLDVCRNICFMNWSINSGMVSVTADLPESEVWFLFKAIIEALKNGNSFGSLVIFVEEAASSSLDSDCFMCVPISDQEFTQCGGDVFLHVALVRFLGSILADFILNVTENIVEDVSTLQDNFEKFHSPLLSELFQLFSICLSSLSTVNDVEILNSLRPLSRVWGRIGVDSVEFMSAVVRLFPVRFLVQSLRNDLVQYSCKDTVGELQCGVDGYSLSFLISFFQYLEDFFLEGDIDTQAEDLKCLADIFMKLVDLEKVLSISSKSKSISEICPNLCQMFSCGTQLIEVQSEKKVDMNEISFRSVTEETEASGCDDIAWVLCYSLLLDRPVSIIEYCRNQLFPEIIPIMNMMWLYHSNGNTKCLFDIQIACKKLWKLALLSPLANNTACDDMIVVLFTVFFCIVACKCDGEMTSVDGGLWMAVEMLWLADAECDHKSSSATLHELANIIFDIFLSSLKSQRKVALSDGHAKSLPLAVCISCQHTLLDLYGHCAFKTVEGLTSTGPDIKVLLCNKLVDNLYTVFSEVPSVTFESHQPHENEKFGLLADGCVVSFALWLHASAVIILCGKQLLHKQCAHLCGHRYSISSKQVLKFASTSGQSSVISSVETSSTHTCRSVISAVLDVIAQLENNGIVVEDLASGFLIFQKAASCTSVDCDGANNGSDNSTIFRGPSNRERKLCQSCTILFLLAKVQERWKERFSHKEMYCNPSLIDVDVSNIRETGGGDVSPSSPTSMTEIMWSSISLDCDVALDVVRHGLSHALDLYTNPAAGGNDHSNKKHKKVKGKGKKRKAKEFNTLSQLSTTEEGQAILTDFAGRKLIRKAIYFSYLCHPQHVLDCVIQWVKTQLDRNILPKHWVDNASKRLLETTSSRQKRKRQDDDSSKRRSSRLKGRHDDAEIVTEVSASLVDNVSSNPPPGEKLPDNINSNPESNATLEKVIEQDFLLCFHLLILMEEKQFKCRRRESGRDDTELYYQEFQRNCTYDLAVASALHMLEVTLNSSVIFPEFTDENNNVQQINSDSLLLNKASSFLVTLSKTHPSLWLHRYSPLVVKVLSSQLISASSSSHASKKQRFEQLLLVVCKTYEECRSSFPVLSFLSSVSTLSKGDAVTKASSSVTHSLHPSIKILGDVVEKLQEHLKVDQNEQEVNSLLEDVLLCIEAYSEDRLIGAIVKEKRYVHISKLLSQLVWN